MADVPVVTGSVLIKHVFAELIIFLLPDSSSGTSIQDI